MIDMYVRRKYLLLICLSCVFCMWIYLSKSSGDSPSNEHARSSKFSGSEMEDGVSWDEDAVSRNELHEANEEIRLRRLAVLHKVCEQLRKEKSNRSNALKTPTRPFLYDEKRGVLLQAIPKTGCTTWKMAFLNNSGSIHLHDPSSDNELRQFHRFSKKTKHDIYYTSSMSRSDLMEALKTSFSILTVRHPFDRLESAYVDKIIILNYHNAREAILRKKGHTDAQVKELAMNGTNVKFEGFLDYILGRQDAHWNSIYSMAAPCHVPYSFISKTETLNMDLDYIRDTKLHGKGKTANLNIKRAVPLASDKGKHMPLFSGMDNKMYWIERVLRYYKEDIDLFGYSYRVREDGSVYATCMEYDKAGHCV